MSLPNIRCVADMALGYEYFIKKSQIKKLTRELENAICDICPKTAYEKEFYSRIRYIDYSFSNRYLIKGDMQCIREYMEEFKEVAKKIASENNERASLSNLIKSNVEKAIPILDDMIENYPKNPHEIFMILKCRKYEFDEVIELNECSDNENDDEEYE